MPQLFTPKFVDMVRVTTSTQGTGPLVCGPAVQGYASFAESVSAGDVFYYSVQGIDKPAEREVGRGTYQANGTISRQPVKGALTNFTSGAKTIALVASSEWYARMQDVGAAADRNGVVDSRTALAAITAEAGMCRSVVQAGSEVARFVFSNANCAALVSADSRQAMVVAPASAPSGSAGAWIRQHDGALQAAWFGLKPDFNPLTLNAASATDNRPAMLALKAYLDAVAVATTGNYGFRTAPCVEFDPGAYFLSDTIDWDNAVYDLRSVGGGQNSGANFYFAAGKDGFRVHWLDTQGKLGITAPRERTAAYSRFKNIHLWSLGNASAAGPSGGPNEQDGWSLRTRIIAENCSANQFSRHGWHIYAAAGTSIQGNANSISLTDCSAVRNRCAGIHLVGGDANAGKIVRFTAYYNGYAGIWDNSFLGNTWDAPDSGDNSGIGAGPLWGLNTAGPFCRHDAGAGKGLTIWQVKRGRASDASTTAPAWNASNPWRPLVPGYVNDLYPAWVSGMTFTDGAGYIFENSQNSSVITGGYTEGTDPAPSINCLTVGGLLAGTVTNGPGLFACNNLVASRVGFRQQSTAQSRVDRTLAINQLGSGDLESSSRVLYFADGRHSDLVSADPQVGVEVKWDANRRDLGWYDSGSGALASAITGPAGALSFGRDAPVTGALWSGRFYLGNQSEAREFGSATTMPSSGSRARGDFIRNTQPMLAHGQAVLGWHRLTTGSSHEPKTDWHAVRSAPAMITLTQSAYDALGPAIDADTFYFITA